MSIDTLLRVGHEGAAGRFIHFIRNILIKKSDSFQIMYGIRGERTLTEETLDHLAGYKDTKPVRIGNAAYHQKQNDSFGYLMDVIFKYYQFFPGTLDDIEDMYEIVKNIMRTVLEDWRNPDKGIWEIRGQEQHLFFEGDVLGGTRSWCEHCAYATTMVLPMYGSRKRWPFATMLCCTAGTKSCKPSHKPIPMPISIRHCC